ncbi:hypothetical protein P43SY_000609 [Pythium insidiosum]|uniref:Kazal-like domain-containing protein n=1 Tax=Pythium insidiosum TaxID=114742 RepID=A0AAD5Q8P7_PYTIN|nr:hypothetical protein P43SY_000609 [Pythium insidiosum]
MRTTLLIALVAVVAVASPASADEKKNCSAGCPRTFRPVCGSDGKTYSNQCMFDYEKCKSGRNDLRVVKQGECLEDDGVSIDCSQPLRCSMEYAPVCGSDNKTYGNLCALKTAQCTQKTLKLKKKGPCDGSSDGSKAVMPPSKRGGSEGSDGSGDIDPDDVGGCEKPCTKEIDFVCGSDGVTYNNPCLFDIAKCKAPALMKKSDGECTPQDRLESPGTRSPVATPKATSAASPLPTCGIIAAVAAACAAAAEPNESCVTKMYRLSAHVATAALLASSAMAGQPPPDAFEAKDCVRGGAPPCAVDCSPICGSDGVTYKNECWLKWTQACGGSGGAGLTTVAPGACKSPDSTWKPAKCDANQPETGLSSLPDLSHCSKGSAPSCPEDASCTPVCGSDGVSYQNECWFKWALCSNSTLEMASGACAKGTKWQPEACKPSSGGSSSGAGVDKGSIKKPDAIVTPPPTKAAAGSTLSPWSPLAVALVPPTLRLADDRELVLRHVLFFHRHGDRSPILTSIGDRWRMTADERDFWAARLATLEQLAALDRISRVVGDDASMPPHGPPHHRELSPLAQLTAHGVEHMVSKGAELRKQYEAFIAASPGLRAAPQDHVYVLSSNIDRTIQSVQCLLHGMFVAPTIGASLAPAPVKQFSICTHAQNVLAPAHSVKLFGEIESIVSDAVAARSDADRASIDSLGSHLRAVLGIASDRSIPWTAIRDGLTCRKAHDVPFPDGIDDAMYEIMCEYDAWLWHTLYSRRSFCVGAFREGVREVHRHLQRVVQSLTTRDLPTIDMSFFSAHDNSIVALVCALELGVERILPEYGTVLTLELYEDAARSGSFHVRVLFQGEPVGFLLERDEEKTQYASRVYPFEFFEGRVARFMQEDHA